MFKNSLRSLPLIALMSLPSLSQSLADFKYEAKVSNKKKKKEEKPLLKTYLVADVIANNNNKYTRKITICVVLGADNKIKAGYSVLNTGDEYDHELGKTISLGRAMNPKTDLFADKDYRFSANNVLTKDYGRTILKSIGHSIIKQIEDGRIIIKGIV